MSPKYLLALFILEINFISSLGQFIERQADRMQIMYVEIVSSETDQAEKRVTFPTPFLNVPTITYSLLRVRTSLKGEGFSITTSQVATTDVLVKIKANPGNKLLNIKIGILATDFPNSISYQDSVSASKYSNLKSYTTPGDILGYCVFVNGFKGNITFAYIQFSLSSYYQNNTVFVQSQFIPIGHLDYLNYNILIIYQNNSVDYLLYSFSFFQTLEIKAQNYSLNTNLPETDKIFFGFGDFRVASYFEYDFFVEGQNPDQIISNKQINLKTGTNKGYYQGTSISIFQLSIRYCPIGKFIIKSGSDYQCVSECSTVNSRTYNDPTNFLQMDYNQYPMNLCSTCHSSCYGCSGPTNSECTSCDYNQFFVWNKKECTQTQPNRTYCIKKTRPQ